MVPDLRRRAAVDSRPRTGGGDDVNLDTPDDGDGKQARGGGSESLLSGITNASGPVIVVTLVIATMSFYLIALVVWMALNYRTTTAIPAGLVRDVQDLLDQSKYNEAYHRLVADTSFLARVLAAGVRKLPAGLSQAQRAMRAGQREHDDGDGTPHHVSGNRGHARAHDRPGRNGLRHDHRLSGDRS